MRDNGMMKAQQRAYYFLDYSKATDVIKWRMWRIQQTIDVKLRNVRLVPLALLLPRLCLGCRAHH